MRLEQVPRIRNAGRVALLRMLQRRWKPVRHGKCELMSELFEIVKG
jgi:hypothetical protein